jgi:hypothetical protein
MFSWLFFDFFHTLIWFVEAVIMGILAIWVPKQVNKEYSEPAWFGFVVGFIFNFIGVIGIGILAYLQREGKVKQIFQ